MQPIELLQNLPAVALLLLSAHGCGRLFAVLRQPRVIGEIVGGLLLGPTLLSNWFPAVGTAIFAADESTPTLMAFLSKAGLAILMFTSGTQLCAIIAPTERKLVLSLAIAGVFVPFGVGAVVVPYLDSSSIIGPANNEAALLLVFATAVAIASIPVISRIMLDLGIMQTSFARVVIATAIVDDLVLYIVLAVAVGLTQTTPAGHSIPTWLVIDAASFWSPLYHVAVTLLIIAFLSVAGPPLMRQLFSAHWSWLKWDGGAVSQASFLLVAVALCAALKVNPMFGALAAGLAVARASQDSQASHSQTIAVAGSTFFTPLFFAITGFKIDLIHHFDPVLLIGFLSFACVAKAVCTYAGARLAGETRRMALNFAAALNARGGPGIVLAGVALESQIINENFFATLVMTAVLTSLMAGVWLGYAVKGEFSRLESGAPPTTTRQQLALAES